MTLPVLPPLQTIAGEGGTYAWREAGAGEALVFVHGIGGSSASWAHQFADFAGGHRVLAWDAPGYGGSSPLASEPARVEAYAAALVAWLDALGISEASFVGHSLGSLFIAAASRLRPTLVQRVLFLHPVTGNGQMPAEEREVVRQGRIRDLVTLGGQGFAEQRGRSILARDLAPEKAADAIAVMADVPEQGYLTAWDAMCEGDIFRDVDAVKCPALVVCGNEDPVSPEATGRSIAAAIPGAGFVLLPGVGHYASIEAPERLRDILSQFLETETKA
jgi:pimeloyl-ACP methyl ester carboxylesterase